MIGANTLATGKNQYGEEVTDTEKGFAAAAIILPIIPIGGTGKVVEEIGEEVIEHASSIEKLAVKGSEEIAEHANEIESGVEKIVKGEIHHIASDKAIKSGYIEQFENIFNNAGMTLDDDANKVFLENHSGGHTVKYKEYVLDKLDNATRGLSGDDANKALKQVLIDLKTELINNPRIPYKGGIK